MKIKWSLEGILQSVMNITGRIFKLFCLIYYNWDPSTELWGCWCGLLEEEHGGFLAHTEDTEKALIFKHSR